MAELIKVFISLSYRDKWFGGSAWQLAHVTVCVSNSLAVWSQEGCSSSKFILPPALQAGKKTDSRNRGISFLLKGPPPIHPCIIHSLELGPRATPSHEEGCGSEHGAEGPEEQRLAYPRASLSGLGMSLPQIKFPLARKTG